jgi:hypothetical protein
MKICGVALMLAVFLTGAALSPVADKRVLSVLIVDGINNHDWEAGTRGIQALLAAAPGRFRVDVSTTPPREAPAEEWKSWRP